MWVQEVVTEISISYIKICQKNYCRNLILLLNLAFKFPVICTLQAALLLKSQVESVGSGSAEQMDLSPDVDISTLIGTSLGRIDRYFIRDEDLQRNAQILV